MQRYLPLVVTFLLVANISAAQDEIPCDRSLIVYEHATSPAECFKGVGGVGHIRLKFDALWDFTDNSATSIVV